MDNSVRRAVLEKRITRLEKLVNSKIKTFESDSLYPTVYGYIIHSSITDEDVYFLSKDKNNLKSNVVQLENMFFKAVEAESEDDDDQDYYFGEFLRFCHKNNITFIDEAAVEDGVVLKYREYLDWNNYDIEDSDPNIALSDLVFDSDKDLVFGSDKLYRIEVVGKHTVRF